MRRAIPYPSSRQHAMVVFNVLLTHVMCMLDHRVLVENSWNLSVQHSRWSWRRLRHRSMARTTTTSEEKWIIKKEENLNFTSIRISFILDKHLLFRHRFTGFPLSTSSSHSAYNLRCLTLSSLGPSNDVAVVKILFASWSHHCPQSLRFGIRWNVVERSIHRVHCTPAATQKHISSSAGCVESSCSWRSMAMVTPVQIPLNVQKQSRTKGQKNERQKNQFSCCFWWGAKTRSQATQNTYERNAKQTEQGSWGERKRVRVCVGVWVSGVFGSESTPNMWNCGWYTNHFWFSPILKYTLLLRPWDGSRQQQQQQQHTIPFAVMCASVFIHFIIMYTFKHKLGLLFAWHFVYTMPGCWGRVWWGRNRFESSRERFFFRLFSPSVLRSYIFYQSAVLHSGLVAKISFYLHNARTRPAFTLR